MKNLALFALAVAGTLSMSTFVGGCSSSDRNEPTPPAAPKSYVLVHGAWMGAWCWNEVAQQLRADGEIVTTVELPAHGDDHTALADATLDAYVAKVSAAVDTSATPVILVGHSLGGVVVTAVAEHEPSKIAKLVYVGAFLPKDGQSLFDLASTDPDARLGKVLVIDKEHGIASVPTDSLADVFLADGSPDEVSLLQSRYRDEPLAPFVTPVHTTAANWGAVTKAYIFTKEDHAISYGAQQRMTAGVAFAKTAVIDTSHSPFLSQPAIVVSSLRGM